MGSTSGLGGGRDGFFSHWLRGLFSGNGSAGAGRRKRKGGLQARRLRFEACEQRQLLAIGVDFDLAAGALTLSGTSATDRVSVVGKSSYLDVYADGGFHARLLNANSSNVNSIAFSGGAGADSLAVQNIQLGGSLAIDLTDAETLSVLKSKNVAVNSNAALNLGMSSISGTLDIIAGGGLTQTGQVVVAGATTLDVAGSDITLANAGNNFGTLSLTGAAQNVSLRDVNAIVLGDMAVDGDLVVQANLNSTSRTAISQSTGTAISVSGATTLAVGPASTIMLNNDTGNAFAGTVTITGAVATLRNTQATDLGPSRVIRNLTLSSDGDVTQSGALFVGQTAAISAAAGANIDLSTADNDFRTVTLSAASVLLNDVNSLAFGKSTIDGTLDVTTDGNITQVGALTVADAATLNAGDRNNIVLTNTANDFLSVTIVAAENVSLRDKNSLELGASTVSGVLTVTAVQGISQSGAWTVADKTTLMTGSLYDITLTEDNDFEELAIVSGRNVQLTDTSELLLATSRIYGTLTVNAGADVTQSGALTVAKMAAFHLAAGDLTLNHASNNFGTVTIPDAPGNVWLRDSNSLVLGNATVAGDLVLQANLNSSSRIALSQVAGTAITVDGSTTLAAGAASTITLNNPDNLLHGSDLDDTLSVVSATATLQNNQATNLGQSNVSRNLTLTSAGGITQSGAVVVGRTAALSAAAATDIVLTDADNDFGTLMASAQNVVLNDLNALVLGTATLTGDLNVTTNGAISQFGSLSVYGATTLNAGQDNNICLASSGNHFLSVGVAAARNVVLRDADDLILDASAISGILSVTTAGDITQSGALEVAEKTTLTAGAAGNITLTESANNFSEISIVSGNDVSLVNAEALILASSKISGALDVLLDSSASGGLTQSGAVVVVGTTTLTAGTNDIELLNSGNNFSTLAVSGMNVALRDISTIELDSSTVTGDLALTAGGAITQIGALTVDGTATLATSPSASITLANPANVLNALAVTAANDVMIASSGALVLGASIVSGDLTVAASGDLTQSGALAVAGTLTINAGAANVDLSTQLDNDFSTVDVTGQSVSLHTTNSIVLAAATIAGDLAMQAAGSITDQGTVTVAGATTLSAGTDILLDSSASAYTGILSLEGANVSLLNTVTTLLGDCTATGDFTIALYSADVAPTMSNSNDGGATHGIIIVGGTATFDAGVHGMDPAHTLVLYTAGCQLDPLVTVGNVTIIP